jgi:hypothetical protein
MSTSSTSSIDRIQNLHDAVVHFTLEYEKTLPALRTIRMIRALKKTFVLDLDPKFLLQDYDKHESGLGIVVKQQYSIKRPPPILNLGKNHKPKPIPSCAYILEEQFDNPLGLPDLLYSYVVLRKKLTSHWAQSLGLPKYEDAQGTWCPHTILKHIVKNKIEDQSRLVVIVSDTNKIFMAKGRDLCNFFVKWNEPVFINNYAEYITGFPIELFKELSIPTK